MERQMAECPKQHPSLLAIIDSVYCGEIHRANDWDRWRPGPHALVALAAWCPSCIIHYFNRHFEDIDTRNKALWTLCITTIALMLWDLNAIVSPTESIQKSRQASASIQGSMIVQQEQPLSARTERMKFYHVWRTVKETSYNRSTDLKSRRFPLIPARCTSRASMLPTSFR